MSEEGSTELQAVLKKYSTSLDPANRISLLPGGGLIRRGRRMICEEQKVYMFKMLTGEPDASTAFGEESTLRSADNTLNDIAANVADFSHLSPASRAFARLPAEERKKIEMARFKAHRQKQMRYHVAEKAVFGKYEHLTPEELAKQLSEKVNRECENELTNASEGDSELEAEEAMERKTEQRAAHEDDEMYSVQSMEVDELTFRASDSLPSARPSTGPFVSHSTPLLARGNPRMQPINLSTILMANNSNVSAGEVPASRPKASLVSSTFDQLDVSSPGPSIFARKRLLPKPAPSQSTLPPSVPLTLHDAHDLSTSFPAPRASRQLSTSFGRNKRDSDNLTDTMEKSIEFSAMNQHTVCEKTQDEGLQSMVDPVTERRPARSSRFPHRESTTLNKTPTGTPTRAIITERSQERRLSILARPKIPGSCSKPNCGHHHQQQPTCTPPAASLSSRLTPVRRLHLDVSASFPLSPSVYNNSVVSSPIVQNIQHSGATTVSPSVPTAITSPASGDQSTVLPHTPNASHHRIVYYSSSSSGSEDEQEDEEEAGEDENAGNEEPGSVQMQIQSEGEEGRDEEDTSLNLHFDGIHIDDNNGANYGMPDLDDDPSDAGVDPFAGRPSSLYTSITQATVSRLSTRPPTRITKKGNRDTIFSTNTPGLQQLSTSRFQTTTNGDLSFDCNDKFDALSKVGRKVKEELPKSLRLVSRKLIRPKEREEDGGEEMGLGVRRSQRTRVPTCRGYLGERPIYKYDANGDREMVGVSEVEIKEKRFLKTRTASPRKAMERESQLRHLRLANAKRRKQNKIELLKRCHRRGERLNETVESIVTSEDEE